MFIETYIYIVIYIYTEFEKGPGKGVGGLTTPLAKPETTPLLGTQLDI